MNFDEFFAAAGDTQLLVQGYDGPRNRSEALSNEALFHLPLLAMTVLVLAKGRAKPDVSSLGQIVGACFERVFLGFKGSSQQLGWSANLRVRTVKALTFLEYAGLVEVSKGTSRIVATKLGRKVAEKAMMREDALAVALFNIVRAYRDVSIEKQIEMSLP